MSIENLNFTEEVLSDPLTDAERAVAESSVGLVHMVVGGVIQSYGEFMERDDMTSYGFFGLCDAARKYDPTLETEFSTYAVPRIRGAILDGNRTFNKTRRQQVAISLLNNSGTVALDKPLADAGGTTYGEQLADNFVLEDEVIDLLQYRERRDSLYENITKLSPRAQQVLSAYLAGQSQASIARESGVTENAVSACIKKATAKLKMLLAEHTGLELCPCLEL